jgi:hypothetical protein
MRKDVFFQKVNYLSPVLTGLSLITLFFFISCHKDDDHGDPSRQLIFSSLQAEKDTILSGEATKISAVASGYKIEFFWSATSGDILGSGAQVLYAASPCHAGKNKIECTVKDGNDQSETKEIYVVVE